ncbi:RNA methyltransferase [soil metagenome]
MTNAPDDLRHLTSSANPIVKLARQLATRRRARYRERLFIIEGTRPIATAIGHGARIQTLIIDEERRDGIDPAFLVSIEERVDRTVTMPPALFQSFTDTEHPQPVAAIVMLPDSKPPTAAKSIVCLDAVRDPGNLGAILRTAVAAGVDGIALLPGCVDPFNPKVVRASAGLVTAIPIHMYPSITEAVGASFDNQQEVVIIAADAAGSIDYRDVHWKEPVLVVVGNEAAGLSEPSRLTVGHRVSIPMAEGVESLNVSAATAILLFEMRRQRSGRID